MASQKKRGERSAPAPAKSAAPVVGAKGGSRNASEFQLSHILILAMLIAITVAAWSNSFYGGNTLDNYQLLRLDPRIQQANSQNIGDILHHTYWWPYGESGLYRPLATLSYLFNYAILGEGENTAGYHAVNLLLHLCNIALAYALGLRLLGTRGRAFALAALWAVHPVLTESVTNMVGRPDLLAGMGVLGGFLFYLVATDAAGAHRGLALAGAAAAVTIGVFSKESAVTVIGVIAVYEFVWWKERRAIEGRLAAGAAIAIPIAAMLLVRFQVMSSSGPAAFPFLDNPLVGAGFVQGRLTALAILARYLWRLVCPITLSADYSYNQIPLASGAASDWISWLVVALLVVVIVVLYRRNRTAFFFALFAAVTFVPMSNLLFPIGTIMAERFLYLPALAFCACLVLAWSALPARVQAAAPVAAGVLVAAYGLRTWLRNPDWWSDLNMAQALIKTSPNSYKVRKMLAFQSFRADPSHANLDQVIANADAGLAILDPVPNHENNAEAYRFAGGYYFEKADALRQSDPAGSEAAYHHAAGLFVRALSIMSPDPNQPNAAAGDAWRILSLTYQRLGDAAKAVDAGVHAVRMDPVAADKYLQLGRAQIQSNQPDAAAVTLLEGQALAPDQRLSRELVTLFRTPLDTSGCAVNQTQQGMALNPMCPSVKRFLCPAFQAAIGTATRAGRADLAAKLARDARQDFSCPAN